MNPIDINVFPVGTPNQQITDAKQYRAAQRSLEVLEAQLKEAEEYGKGYVSLLSQRITETRNIITKLEEKYKDL
jgi:hypothetical protein